MAEDYSLYQFKDAFRFLRNADDYSEAMINIGKLMRLRNDNGDTVDELAIHILLIKATKDKFGDTIQADIVLAALGLLDGYQKDIDAPPEAVGEILITARRTKFLYESSYIAYKYGNINNKKVKHHSRTYEEVVQMPKAPDDRYTPLQIARSTLGSEDGDLIDEVAEMLYDVRDPSKYLSKAIEEYGIVNGYGRIVGVKYPKLINVRQDADAAPRKTDEPAAKNTDIAVELASTETSAPVETQGDFTDEVDAEISPQLRKKQIDSKSILSVLSALAAVLSLVSLVVIWSTYPKQETIINQVSIVEEKVTLEPGRFATLHIDYVPEDADPGILDCSEGYDDRLLFANIDKLWTNSTGAYPALTIGAREPWNGDLPYDAAVKVKADENICDYVDVTVIERTPIDLTGNNADDVTGEKTDVAP